MTNDSTPGSTSATNDVPQGMPQDDYSATVNAIAADVATVAADIAAGMLDDQRDATGQYVNMQYSGVT